MDRKELWNKVKIALEKGFEVTKKATVKSARSMATYAGEAGQVTRAKFHEVKLHRQIARQFAELGARVYQVTEKATTNHDLLGDSKLKDLLTKTRTLHQEWHKAQEKTKSEVSKLRRGAKGKSQK